MEHHYPIFVLVTDDETLEMLTNSTELNRYERIDINNNLYRGWDVNGYPLKMLWDKKKGPMVEISKEEPEKERLKEEIYRYSKYYNEQKPFVYSGPKDDAVELFRAVERHVKEDEPKRTTLLDLFKNIFRKKKAK